MTSRITKREPSARQQQIVDAVAVPGRSVCAFGMALMAGRVPARPATARQWEVLAAYVAAGGSVQGTAELLGIRPGTVKRHLADLRARTGLTTEQLIYAGRASGRLVVPSLEPR